MQNRRQFIQAAGVAAGSLLAAPRLLDAAPAQQSGAPVTRREVRVGGKRVKVVDIHAHATFAEVADVVKGTPLERFGRGGGVLGPDRIQDLDKRGIDIQVLDVNTFWWYAADRDLATKIVRLQDCIDGIGPHERHVGSVHYLTGPHFSDQVPDAFG